jgi:uncharacterized membrane protein
MRSHRFPGQKILSTGTGVYGKVKMIMKKPQTFKTIFISGLLTLIPVVATAVVLLFLFNLFDNWLAPLGQKILESSHIILPLGLKHIPGLGILATFVVTVITGLFVSNYLGKQIVEFGERILENIPVVKNVYSGVRQIMDSFSLEGGSTPFKTVVMFEFPSPGVWTIGFLTTSSLELARQVAGEELMNVFLPAAPIPSNGILLMIPANKLKLLSINAEEALKMIATLGLVQRKNEGEAAGLVDAVVLPESLAPGRSSRRKIPPKGLPKSGRKKN